MTSSKKQSRFLLFLLSFMLAWMPIDGVIGQTITIDPNAIDHPLSSHIIGVCRNHVMEQTVPPTSPNNTSDYSFAEKLERYGSITPSFGGRKLYRFGGGMVDGVPGDPYGLSGWEYPINQGQTGPYPYDDFQFYLNEASTMDADLMIGINVGSGTVEQAADLVRDLCTTLVDENNDPWIKRVALFEMGNELSGSWQKGHKCSVQEYLNAVNPIIEAMRAAAQAEGYGQTLPIGLMGSYNQAWDWDYYQCDPINGWAANDPNNTTGNYDATTTFGPYPVSGGDLNFLISDNTFNCNTNVYISSPSSCVDPCAMSAVVLPPVYKDNDPDDDTFSFDVSMGSNVGTQWTANDPNNTTGNYDATTTFGPYLVSGGDLNFTITSDNPDCSIDISVSAPAPTSSVCPFDFKIKNWTCNDGGTPSDSSDDTFTFDADAGGFYQPYGQWKMEIDAYLSSGIDFQFICFHGYTSVQLALLNTERVKDNGDLVILKCDDGQDMTDNRAAQSLFALNHWAINNRITQIQGMLEGTGVQLANTEYATHINQAIRESITHSMVQAMFAADNMLTAIKHNIPIANNYAFFMASSTVTDNTFNLMFEPNFNPDEDLNPKPVFTAHEMIAENLGNNVLSDLDVGSTPMFGKLDVIGCGASDEILYPKLSFASTISDNGEISTLIVNRTFGDDAEVIPMTFDMSGYFAELMSYVGSGITDENPIFTDFECIPTGINPFTVDIQPLSINILKLTPVDSDFYVDVSCTTASFKGPEDNPANFTYSWDFGDGSTSTELHTEHTYTTNVTQTYTVVLTITNSNGCTKSESQDVEIIVEPINSVFTYVVDNDNCNVTFTGPIDNPIGITYTWDFGDGTTSTDLNPTHTYAANGSYPVTLTVKDDCDNSVNSIITVTIDCIISSSCEPCAGSNSYNIDAGAGMTWGQTGLSNFLWDPCMTISGRLIIDRHVVILYGELKMDKGAEIVIQSGATLELDAVNKSGGVHGCNFMWKGITVNQGGRLYMSTNGAPVPGTTIQDAQYAIKAMDNSFISVLGAKFINNYVGIYVPPSVIDGWNNVNQGLLGQNTFYGTGIMLPKFDGQAPDLYTVPNVGTFPYAGIKVHRTSINIGSSSWMKNKFERLKYGIIGDKSSIYSYFSDMKDIFETGVHLYDGIYAQVEDNKIENARIGVYIDRTIGGNFDRNTIINVRKGIHLRNMLEIYGVNDNSISKFSAGIVIYDFSPYITDLRIAENTFNNTLGWGNGGLLLDGVYPFGDVNGLVIDNVFTNCVQGISVSGANELGIENNDIFFNPAFYGFGGIVVTDAPNSILFGNTITNNSSNVIPLGFSLGNSHDSKVCCNISINNNKAFRFELSNDNSKFRHNAIVNSEKGLYMKNSMFGTQYQADNSWIGGGNNATYYKSNGNYDDIVFSQFIVSGCGSPAWPSAIDPVQACPGSEDTWFQSIDGVVSSCEADANCMRPSDRLVRVRPEITENDIRFASKGYQFSFGSGLLWSKMKQLYRKLLDNQEFLELDISLNEFFIENESKPIAQLVFLEKEMEALYELSNDELSMMFSQSKKVQNELINLAKVDSLITKDSVNNVSRTYIQQRGDVIQKLSSINEKYLSIQENLENNREMKIIHLLLLNSQIEVSSEIEQFEKLVNDIYLRIQLDENLIKNDDIDVLLNIANSCPTKYSGVVFKARALSLRFNEVLQFDDEDCSPEENVIDQFNPVFQDKNRFLIHPNPTNEFVSIYWPIDIDSGKEIRVDVLKPMGGLMKSVSFSGLEGSKSLEFDLEPGIYYLNFYLAGKFLEKQTLIVVE